MRDRAQRNVAAAGLAGSVQVEEADVLDLPYPDSSFDCVVAEAVTMSVDRERAAAELARVCRPGGQVLATEFCWRRPPTEQARRIFLGEVCPRTALRHPRGLGQALRRRRAGRRPNHHRRLRHDDRPRLPHRRRLGHRSRSRPSHDAARLPTQNGLADASHAARRALPRLHRHRRPQAPAWVTRRDHRRLGAVAPAYPLRPSRHETDAADRARNHVHPPGTRDGDQVPVSVRRLRRQRAATGTLQGESDRAGGDGTGGDPGSRGCASSCREGEHEQVTDHGGCDDDNGTGDGVPLRQPEPTRESAGCDQGQHPGNGGDGGNGDQRRGGDGGPDGGRVRLARYCQDLWMRIVRNLASPNLMLDPCI